MRNERRGGDTKGGVAEWLRYGCYDVELEISNGESKPKNQGSMQSNVQNWLALRSIRRRVHVLSFSSFLMQYCGKFTSTRLVVVT